jgi:hypothetical protein
VTGTTGSRCSTIESFWWTLAKHLAQMMCFGLSGSLAEAKADMRMGEYFHTLRTAEISFVCQL